MEQRIGKTCACQPETGQAGCIHATDSSGAIGQTGPDHTGSILCHPADRRIQKAAAGGEDSVDRSALPRPVADSRHCHEPAADGRHVHEPAAGGELPEGHLPLPDSAADDQPPANRAVQPRRISEEAILLFAELLRENEKSDATVEKYTRDVGTFRKWLGEDGHTDKERTKHYKQYLRENYKLSSANSMLSALNTFFKYMEWNECRINTFKTQRTSFRNTERELSIQEYHRLLDAAITKTGKSEEGGRVLALIMETLAGTGIRVSELPFITVASLATRRAAVALKGKTREVLLSAALCKKLRAYCREKGIEAGSIFVTKSGRPIDRSNILRRMKGLSAAADVLRTKIFPHNLRHLFAVTYYEKQKDIARLADILGHANINTTRIYTLVSCEAQFDALDSLSELLTPA